MLTVKFLNANYVHRRRLEPFSKRCGVTHESAEFGHRPDCIPERQGLPGRIGFSVVARRSKTVISAGENATVGD